MITKKEFYFIRHGQTDYNATSKVDPPENTPLNTTGRSQANSIEPIIASLPVKNVCSSPLRRAQETKEIVTARLLVGHYEISDLRECSGNVWREMTALGRSAHLQAKGSVFTFMQRVRKGINQALEQEGPVLIVAHGGIHWAICCFLEANCKWAIDNCVPVHFAVGNDDKWTAKRLV